MVRFPGLDVERDGYATFKVDGGQAYRSATVSVEPDASNAGYFWAAAAITGTSITVKGLSLNSIQGDIRFAKVLGKMGCEVEASEAGICVTGKKLAGIDIDMGHMPDMVPTLAVVAAYHRMAMSFAVAGLRAPGTFIWDETCVKKSFPLFWQAFNALYR